MDIGAVGLLSRSVRRVFWNAKGNFADSLALILARRGKMAK
jgi:hypothetical protein